MKNKKPLMRAGSLALSAAILGSSLTACGQQAATVAGSDVLTVSDQMEAGIKYLQQLDYESAILAFQAAIDLDKSNAQAYAGLYAVYTALGQTENAEAILQQVLDEPSVSLTNVTEQVLHTAEIIESAGGEKAHVIDASIAEAAFDNGQYEAAAKAYEEVLKKDPENKEALAGAYISNIAAGNTDKADEILKKAEEAGISKEDLRDTVLDKADKAGVKLDEETLQPDEDAEDEQGSEAELTNAETASPAPTAKPKAAPTPTPAAATQATPAPTPAPAEENKTNSDKNNSSSGSSSSSASSSTPKPTATPKPSELPAPSIPPISFDGYMKDLPQFAEPPASIPSAGSTYSGLYTSNYERLENGGGRFSDYHLDGSLRGSHTSKDSVDENGRNVTTYCYYNSADQLTKTEIHISERGAYGGTYEEYNAFGVKIHGGHYTSTGSGNWSSSSESEIDPTTHTATVTYYKADGTVYGTGTRVYDENHKNVLREVDADGYVTVTEYHVNGYTWHEINYRSEQDCASDIKYYEIFANFGESEGQRINIHYDTTGKMSCKHNEAYALLGDVFYNVYTDSYDYDSSGKVTYHSRNGYDQDGNAVSVYFDGSDYETISGYTVKQEDIDGNTVRMASYHADGSFTGATQWTYDAFGNETSRTEFDAQGNIKYRREYGISQTTGLQEWMRSYSHDDQNRVSAIWEYERTAKADSNGCYNSYEETLRGYTKYQYHDDGTYTVNVYDGNNQLLESKKYNPDGTEYIDPDPAPDPGEGIEATGFCGDNLTWALSADGTLTISGTGEMTDYYDADSIEDFRAYKDQIKNVIVEFGVTSIGENTFRDIGLTSITLPESLTTIGGRAFCGCTALTTVNYTGTQEQWEKIQIDNSDNGNDPFINAQVVYNYSSADQQSLQVQQGNAVISDAENTPAESAAKPQEKAEGEEGSEAPETYGKYGEVEYDEETQTACVRCTLCDTVWNRSQLNELCGGNEEGYAAFHEDACEAAHTTVNEEQEKQEPEEPKPEAPAQPEAETEPSAQPESAENADSVPEE